MNKENCEYYAGFGTKAVQAHRRSKTLIPSPHVQDDDAERQSECPAVADSNAAA